MSGHNKWSTIKHKKAAVDAKRSKSWTKLIKEITVAARMGGGDPAGNPRLRTAIDKGRAANMPNDNIDRAVKKGTGELEGVSYEEILYEGYGPGGTAILIETLTDNRTRTVNELRNAFTKHGGNLGDVGSVGWMFKRRGAIRLDGDLVTEDQVMERALELGADDVRTIEGAGIVEVLTDPLTLQEVKEGLEKAGLAILEAAVEMQPQATVPLEGRPAETMAKLLAWLEDHDDVQNVSSNYDGPSDGEDA
jgi:YebC/PmpR family DNA-binding regulatory protein